MPLKTLISLLLFSVSIVVYSEPQQTFTLSGYVKDRHYGDPVAQCIILDENGKMLALTDNFGFYKLELSIGRHSFMLSAYGYQNTRVSVELFGDKEMNFFINEIIYQLKEAVVSAETKRKLQSSQMGIERLDIARIKHIPVAFGEADIIKSLLTLPGVKSVGEISGGFNVRGGSVDQNLMLYNGSTIFNPTHMFGLFSVIDSEVVKDVELYKGSVPAKYGGRLASVLEINGRKGNPDRIKGSIGIGLLTSKIVLEGPIVKDRTTFIASYRTTYSDWLLKYIPEESGYGDASASFSDASFGFEHKFNKKNKISLNAYYSKDNFILHSNNDNRYTNLNGSLKWSTTIDDNNSFNISLGADHYDFMVEDGSSTRSATEFYINQFYIRGVGRSIISDRHTIEYGFSSMFYDILPGKRDPLPVLWHGYPIKAKILDKEYGTESAIHLSDTWTISDQLEINGGLRLSLYSALGPKNYYTYYEGERYKTSVKDTISVRRGKFVRPYITPELRLSARYKLRDDLVLKAGINTMRQHIHMLSTSIVPSPTAIWKLSDANLRPQDGFQISAGSVYVSEKMLEFSAEAYYKQSYNTLDYKDGAEIFMNENVEQDLIETTNMSFGIELMVRKNSGKLNGWLSYTFSKSLLKESGDKERYHINKGKWYPSSWDRPHEVKLVGNYKFTHRYSISVNADYYSGRPVTIPVGGYIIDDGEIHYYYSGRNSYRIPDFFKVDFAFNIEPHHKVKSLLHATFTIGVYNLTGRRNAHSVFLGYGPDGLGVYKLSIFGSQIPYASLNIKF